MLEDLSAQIRENPRLINALVNGQRFSPCLSGVGTIKLKGFTGNCPQIIRSISRSRYYLKERRIGSPDG
jgi:hypothetical protein